jgi:hypothetical protein
MFSLFRLGESSEERYLKTSCYLDCLQIVSQMQNQMTIFGTCGVLVLMLTSIQILNSTGSISGADISYTAIAIMPSLPSHCGIGFADSLSMYVMEHLTGLLGLSCL